MSVTMPWKASGDLPVNGVATKIDEVRQSLGKEAERLAEMADDYGQQARANAADTADEAVLQAKKTADEQGTRASGWASELTKGQQPAWEPRIALEQQEDGAGSGRHRTGKRRTCAISD